jgi:excinuclease ABC subunit A
MDDADEPELVFSSRFACPTCGYSISELEPRMFSFNNPAGACQACDGLGVKQFFDPALVVQDEELTLAEGAIRGWDRRNVYYFHMLSSLAAHYGFEVETPFRKLTKKHRDAILYGSGRERIDFSYANDRGDVIHRRHRFEGVIPNMERRYHETDSTLVRENLQKYLRVRSCPDCSGTRLREASRNVYIDDVSLPEITSGSVEGSLAYFDKLKLSGRRGEIADKILKEIRARLRFLVDVGLNYLTLDRSAETLSGGEAQRIRLASQIGAGLVGVMYILDEPSIGLHQRDNARLLKTLMHLRDLGNTVLVVEHDEEAIRTADHIIDIGPGAGVHGGRRGRDHRHHRRNGQQSSVRVGENTLRAAHLRNRGFRLGQVDADQPHALPGCRDQTQQSHHSDTSTSGGRSGSGPRRQGGRHRPEPHRPHAALEPCHVYRAVHADPRALRPDPGGPDQGLQARPVQFQRQGRALRGVSG